MLKCLDFRLRSSEAFSTDAHLLILLSKHIGLLALLRDLAGLAGVVSFDNSRARRTEDTFLLD